MKYKIIYEVDGNGKGHYEAQILKKHGICTRWVYLMKYHPIASRAGGYYLTAKYDTSEEAMKDVRAQKSDRYVTDRGEL